MGCNPWISLLISFAIAGYVESTSVPQSWYDWCPATYEKWQNLAELKSRSVSTVPFGRLGLTLADHMDLSGGYKPLAQYEFNLKMHPGHQTVSQFQVVVYPDSDCGGGTLLAADNTTDVTQIFCMHKVESTTHHLTVTWQAPECGCVTLMSGAIISDGVILLGQDADFEGSQAHKICPDPNFIDNKVHSAGIDVDDIVDDVLDPEFYGLVEDDESTDVREEFDYTEDADYEEETYDTDDENLAELETEEIHKKKLCKSRGCKKSKMVPGNNRGMNKKMMKKKLKKQISNTNQGPTNPTTCKGLICKKFHNIMSKHHKLFKTLQSKGKGHRMLCRLAKKPSPPKDQMLQKLGESFIEWIGLWQDWKNSVTQCCDKALKDRKDCISTLEEPQTFLPQKPVLKKPMTKPEKNPMKGEQSDDARLTRVCKRVIKLEWKDRRKPSKYHKAEPHTQQKWQEIWTIRRQKLKDCCEVNDLSERLTCIDDLKADRIDDYCDSDEIGLHSENKWNRASGKCCEHEDDERHECFKEAFQGKRQMNKKAKNKPLGSEEEKSYPEKADKKEDQPETDPRLTRIRSQCCTHGKEEGVAVHGRRWGKCNMIGVQFVDSMDYLIGAKSNMCKKVARRCCLKQSRRTTTEKIKPLTKPPQYQI